MSQIIKLYRVDQYGEFGVGDIIGFYYYLNDAIRVLKNYGYRKRINYADKNYGQITQFEVNDNVMKNVSVLDIKKILSSKIWGNSNIIKTLYYK